MIIRRGETWIEKRQLTFLCFESYATKGYFRKVIDWLTFDLLILNFMGHSQNTYRKFSDFGPLITVFTTSGGWEHCIQADRHTQKVSGIVHFLLSVRYSALIAPQESFTKEVTLNFAHLGEVCLKLVKIFSTQLIFLCGAPSQFCCSRPYLNRAVQNIVVHAFWIWAMPRRNCLKRMRRKSCVT